ncbi:hypothetical protein M413DRAFT_443219 [Hebeloma cylindrosporum]|uniref:Uncharacterized protein n=1 Tax=Hebeloma cylindrosporum TaxID=76867 RepID=A0A0C2YT72_HEBCY|nr:hypothetical protein M413DRAFT_443219 [Hebeloma cylindrosporum h7]
MPEFLELPVNADPRTKIPLPNESPIYMAGRLTKVPSSKRVFKILQSKPLLAPGGVFFNQGIWYFSCAVAGKKPRKEDQLPDL